MASFAAAPYLRQSRRKSDGSEVSTNVQLAECERKIGELSLTPVPAYVDLGVSGYDPSAERKAFNQLMVDARRGLFRYVVVFNMSRFSRQEPLEVLAVVRELWAYGVTIISVTEGAFSPDDFGALISLLVRLEAAHKESHLKSINVRKTKAAAKALGGYIGGPPPYGFEVTKAIRDGIAVQVLSPVAPASLVIKDLVSHMLAHTRKRATKHGRHPASRYSAVEWLNADPRAIPPRGKAWNESSATRILVDPRIAGFAVENIYSGEADERRRKNRAYRILRDSEGREVKACEAIVDPADWYELQAWIDRRKVTGRTSPGESLLASCELLYCECDRTMGRFGPQGGVVAYRCSRRRTDDDGRTHQGGNSITAHHVDDWVARRVMARVLGAEDDPETLDLLVEASRRYAAQTESPQTAGERAELVRARASDLRALEDLYDREEAGEYDDQVGRRRFRERKDRITDRMGAADARLAAIDSQDAPLLPIEEWAGEPGQDPIGEGSWWHSASDDDRREFLKLFVDRIVVEKARQKGGNRLGVQYDPSERVTIRWASSSTRL